MFCACSSIKAVDSQISHYATLVPIKNNTQLRQIIEAEVQVSTNSYDDKMVQRVQDFYKTLNEKITLILNRGKFFLDRKDELEIQEDDIFEYAYRLSPYLSFYLESEKKITNLGNYNYANQFLGFENSNNEKVLNPMNILFIKPPKATEPGIDIPQFSRLGAAFETKIAKHLMRKQLEHYVFPNFNENDVEMVNYSLPVDLISIYFEIKKTLQTCSNLTKKYPSIKFYCDLKTELTNTQLTLNNLKLDKAFLDSIEADMKNTLVKQ
jgi:hypothetical protein